MKVMIITTPIRPIPTTYPPVGSLSLIKYLRGNSCADVEFYNIDANRPTYDETLEHIIAAGPTVLGISAVVSTAYEYTKQLTLDIKARCPEMLIIVGGNLAASAEILLRKTGTDLCVLGEGEKVLLNIVKRAKQTVDVSEFLDIRGLAALDADGKLVVTGYETQIDAAEVDDFDWADLAESCDIEMFFPPGVDDDGIPNRNFMHDPRAYDPQRRDKTFAVMPPSKGCVARCTFCHRWDKGMRYIPVDRYMRTLDMLIEKFNVGFVAVGGENFGTDKRWLKVFCEEIAKREIMWFVGAARTRSVTPEMMDMMVEAGCTNVTYGVESGSPRMLEVMEKKCTLQHNIDAMTWAVQRNMPSIIQLVIGMPGETPETIGETIDFCKKIASLSPVNNPNDTSVNYAQALPGTALYEFGRHRGLIGRSLDEEEKYLLKVSDKDAHDELATLNFTDYPTLECQIWRPRITIETNYAYVKKFGLGHYHSVLLRDARFFKPKREDDGYFANPKRLLDTSLVTDKINEIAEVIELETENRVPSLLSLVRARRFGLAMVCYPVLFYRLRRLLPLIILVRNIFKHPLRFNLSLINECLMYVLTLKWLLQKFPFDYESLRRIVDRKIGPLAGDASELAELRRGR